MSSQVFIGMPVYNGERFLDCALDSLQGQNHTDWKLLISDNASTDRTEEICRNRAALDPRITYVRQDENIGAVANFDYLLGQADGETFMWASSDDEWAPTFIERCLKQLRENPDAGFAFTDIVNIDSCGRTIRTYPSFARFATRSRRLDLITYLRDFEIMGKANLIYSLYKLPFLQKVWPVLRPIWHDPLGAEAGADMGCVLGLLARQPVAITPEVLFRKRMITDRDGEEQFYSWTGRLKNCLPTPLYRTHCRYMIEATKGTVWLGLTRRETTRRWWKLRLYRALRRR